ncbi:MAG: type II secretion system major pseudopilin GspG [Gemmatimonadaceae bacterium]|nr:type II secretion system major pseudopilin GspG [Gemmatimonadaceae bacterium]
MASPRCVPDSPRPTRCSVSSHSERSGFTLLELLVVIAIIAILASFIAPSIFRNVSDAKSTTARSQIETFTLALNAFRLDNDRFPTSDEGLQALRARPVSLDEQSTWKGPYLTKDIRPDPWGRPYVYRSPGDVEAGSFDLYSLGRDGRIGGDGEDADITSWGGAVPP